MDRRAFMALLGLGPAFKRLVPAIPTPLVARWCEDTIVPSVTPDQREFYKTVFTLHMRERSRPGARHHGIMPYAALPEETENA